MVKNLVACRRPRFSPWVRKIPRRRVWQPTPEFLPRESHGQRSLVGYSPLGLKESDMTERLTHTHTYTQHHSQSCIWRVLWLVHAHNTLGVCPE